MVVAEVSSGVGSFLYTPVLTGNIIINEEVSRAVTIFVDPDRKTVKNLAEDMAERIFRRLQSRAPFEKISIRVAD